MQKITRFGLGLIACIVALVAPNLAYGQTMSHGTNQSFDSDGQLRTNTWFGGTNAVVDNVSITSDVSYNEQDHHTYVNVYVDMSGRWGNPIALNQQAQYLVANGMHVSDDFNYSVFSYNGTDYQLNSPVNVHVTANYDLNRYFDDYDNAWHLWGSGNGEFSGNGIMPIHSSSYVSIFEDQVSPDLITHWGFTGSVRYMVLGGTVPLPAPGSAALLGLGGLVAMRRRR